LADTQVEQTHDLTHGVERGDFFFKRANEPHRTEERDELSWVLSLSCHGVSKGKRNVARLASIVHIKTTRSEPLWSPAIGPCLEEAGGLGGGAYSQEETQAHSQNP
jgi:hypothetical protein